METVTIVFCWKWSQNKITASAQSVKGRSSKMEDAILCVVLVITVFAMYAGGHTQIIVSLISVYHKTNEKKQRLLHNYRKINSNSNRQFKDNNEWYQFEDNNEWYQFEDNKRKQYKGKYNKYIASIFTTNYLNIL